MKLFKKKIEVKEPAQGNYIGLATKDETLWIPDVSSCLVVIFQLKTQMQIGGHVPIMWSGKEPFQPYENANKIINSMLTLIKSEITQIVFIGDESNWSASDSPFGLHIVNALLKNEKLQEIPVLFYDKEKIPNAHVHVNGCSIAIENTKTKNLITLDCMTDFKACYLSG